MHDGTQPTIKKNKLLTFKITWICLQWNMKVSNSKIWGTWDLFHSKILRTPNT